MTPTTSPLSLLRGSAFTLSACVSPCGPTRSRVRRRTRPRASARGVGIGRGGLGGLQVVERHAQLLGLVAEHRGRRAAIAVKRPVQVAGPDKVGGRLDQDRDRARVSGARARCQVGGRRTSGLLALRPRDGASWLGACKRRPLHPATIHLRHFELAPAATRLPLVGAVRAGRRRSRRWWYSRCRRAIPRARC